eukprot:6582219-Alexandrium_andersonii.AAC.1
MAVAPLAGCAGRIARQQQQSAWPGSGAIQWVRAGVPCSGGREWRQALLRCAGRGARQWRQGK